MSRCRIARLASLLGISRTPIREALHRLEAAGLATAQGGRTGWLVSPFTAKEVHELFQLRMLFEPAGVDELARNPDPQSVHEIGHFFDDYTKPIPPEHMARYLVRDNAFHTRIVACSGNDRMMSMYAVIEDHVERGRHLADVRRAQDTLDEHVGIAHAILEHDFAGARALLLDHLASAEMLMTQRLARREQLSG